MLRGYIAYWIAGFLLISSLDVLAQSDRAAPVPVPNCLSETDVTVGSGEWALPGTLSLPKVAGPFPGIVLIHGSGPSDRDETIVATKPFRDLAYGLACRGVAVLRYEKRTRHHASKLGLIANSMTVREETTDDAAAAVNALAANSRVDRRRLFLLGHSLGGAMAPRIALGRNDLRGIAIMAGHSRPLPAVLRDQMVYLNSLGNVSENVAKARRVLMAQAEALMDVSKPYPEDARLATLSRAYLEDMRTYDPVSTAQRLTIPVLILQGLRDYQVTAKDLELWKRGLGRNPKATFREYPELNHLFVAGQGKSTPAEYMKPGRVSETVIRDIADWILKQ